MTRFAALSLLLYLYVSLTVASPFRAERWSHTAPIDPHGAPAHGVVEFLLPPEVFDAARPDLADLRVVTVQGAEVGYVARPITAPAAATPPAPHLYNQGFLSGRQSSVTADFRARVMKNSLEIDTTGDTFRRRVRIEGSDDGRRWQIIRNDGMLFRVTEQSAVAYDKNVVTFPQNNQRYLRVTVFNGADDPGAVNIARVRAVYAQPSGIETLLTRVAARTVEQEGKKTLVTLDMGYRNLPLNGVTLLCTDRTFFRRVTVYARNEATSPVSPPREATPAQGTTADAPWSEIARGALYRYPNGARSEEALTIPLDTAKYRYLRLEIANGDNAPLQITGAHATRYAYTVNFQPMAGARYMLYVGNPDATQPDYDLAHYLDRLRSEQITTAALGALAANPVFTSGISPWSERHRAILWIALLAVFAVLLLLITRQLRTAKAVEKQDR